MTWFTISFLRTQRRPMKKQKVSSVLSTWMNRSISLLQSVHMPILRIGLKLLRSWRWKIHQFLTRLSVRYSAMQVIVSWLRMLYARSRTKIWELSFSLSTSSGNQPSKRCVQQSCTRTTKISSSVGRVRLARVGSNRSTCVKGRGSRSNDYSRNKNITTRLNQYHE